PAERHAPALTLRVLEPREFAWERALLVDQEGTPMLEALRLIRPEWYSQQMQVLAVFSWENEPLEPALLRSEQWLGVEWPEGSDRPPVAFVTTADGETGQPARMGRPLLLFGSDPKHPERWQRIGG